MSLQHSYVNRLTNPVTSSLGLIARRNNIKVAAFVLEFINFARPLADYFSLLPLILVDQYVIYSSS